MAVAALPGAIAYAEYDADVELVWAAIAIPVALALGTLAIVLGRRGERQAQLRLSGRTGAATARLGRFLGLVATLLALTALIALAVYAALTIRGRS